MAKDTTPAKDRQGPGPKLRQARDDAGRSLGELAAEMHVGVTHLEAIEVNDYTSLGGRPYVKSYIRAYARCLELDPEPYLEEYEQLGLQDHKWKASDRLEPMEDNRQGVMFGLTLVGGALLIALLFWLFSGDNGPEIDPMEDAALIEDSRADATESTTLNSDNSVFSSTQNKQGWVSEVSPRAEDSEPEEAETVEETVAESEDTAEVVEEDTVAAVDEETAETAVEEKVEAEVAAKEEPPEEKVVEKKEELELKITNTDSSLKKIGEGPDKIALDLRENSWLEIQESNGNVLIRGLLKAGAVREIAGKAPFQVFLGNAPGVNLRFNGENFATSTYIKSNNTARFALVRP